MKNLPANRILLFLLLVASLGAAQAARDITDPFYDDRPEDERLEYDYDSSQDKPWQESQVELPALPDDNRLLKVESELMPPGLTLYIDGGSLTLDPKDRVIRFWSVIKSRAGAYNARYEGMRCDTAQYKVYAYGNPRRAEQPVRSAPEPVWRDVPGRRSSDYHRELVDTLLCDVKGPRPLREILDTLNGRMEYQVRHDTFFED